MPDLPTSGVELVAKGADAYVGDIGKAARATDAFFGGLSRGAGASGAFGEVITGALRRVGEVAVDALGQAAQATAGFLKDSLAVAGDFEQTMNVLGATSGATASSSQAMGQVATTSAASGTSTTSTASTTREVVLGSPWNTGAPFSNIALDSSAANMAGGSMEGMAMMDHSALIPPEFANDPATNAYADAMDKMTADMMAP